MRHERTFGELEPDESKVQGQTKVRFEAKANLKRILCESIQSKPKVSSKRTQSNMKPKQDRSEIQGKSSENQNKIEFSN